MDARPQVRVGVAVFVFKNGAFLMGKRMGSHGEGTWSVPGGHVEFGEEFEATARRELMEEADLTITNVQFGALTNDRFEEHKHYTCVWLTSSYESGEAAIKEPDKCTGWRWCDFDSLPAPLLEPAWEHLFASGFLPEIRRRCSASRHA